MKKQIHATLTRSVLMISPALCASAKSASAQSYKRITAKIPFNFTVGDKTLPAGAYTLRQADVNAPYRLSSEGLRQLRTALRRRFKPTKLRPKRSWSSTSTATGASIPRFCLRAMTQDANF